MTSRPILFSPPMVRALLAGSKTQTRRLIKPFKSKKRNDGGIYSAYSEAEFLALCPYGKRGDTLWAKETWRPEVSHSCAMDACDCANIYVHYAVGGGKFVSEYTISAYEELPGKREWLLPKAALRGKNVSPLFMPAWASRLTLTLADVRVDRLQDITEEDAKEEGVVPLTGIAPDQAIAGENRGRTQGSHPHTLAFAVLWDNLNGEREPWRLNPWVWRLGFTVAVSEDVDGPCP